MSRLKIYGIPMSRVFRVVWMAKTSSLDYENVPIHFADSSSKTPEYLAINPNGKIPAVEDGGLKLWESMAINLYLAKSTIRVFGSTRRRPRRRRPNGASGSWPKWKRRRWQY
jgi:glutathione S-transferase